jgi:hypothetical protein
MRVEVRNLSELYSVLRYRDMAKECPGLKFPGQISVFNGGTSGILIDPFPRGLLDKEPYSGTTSDRGGFRILFEDSD